LSPEGKTHRPVGDHATALDTRVRKRELRSSLRDRIDGRGALGGAALVFRCTSEGQDGTREQREESKKKDGHDQALASLRIPPAEPHAAQII
jgi:hypothetical protein